MKKIQIKSLLFISIIFYSNHSFSQFDDRFYYPSKEWKSIDSLKYESHFIKIESDSLNCLFIYPKEKAKATVFYFHGAGGNVSNYIQFIRPLVKNNFNVIMVDFRGYGKSSGKPSHINVANDAQIIVDYFIRQDSISTKPIILYGASLGSQIAAHLAKKNSGKIKALILDGGMSSFTDIALEGTPDAQKEIVKTYVTSPYSSKEDVQLLDPNTVKLLIIHSRTDSSIPFSHAETVFKNGNEPKSFWIYEGDHLEAPLKEEQLFIEKMNELIK